MDEEILEIKKEKINKGDLYNLFLDDIREPPENHLFGKFPWIIARTTEEAKNIVNEYGVPYFMSLDYDLGGDDTSMIFLKWLSNNFVNSLDEIPVYKVHSSNPVGRENIVSFMKSWKKSFKL